MNENELIRFYKRQVILSRLDSALGKPPRITGHAIQCDETNDYLVSRNGKGGIISEDEYRKLTAEGKIIFGHRII